MSEIKVTQKNIEEIQHKVTFVFPKYVCTLNCSQLLQETRKIWKNTKFSTTSS